MKTSILRTTIHVIWLSRSQVNQRILLFAGLPRFFACWNLPRAKMYTLGSSFMPSPIHASYLRYHGMSTILSELYDQKMMRAISVEQTKVFKAAQMFARVEIILPVPESSHAIRAAPKSQ